MKKLLLLFSFLFLNSILAQPYLPMLEEDHLWSVDIHWGPFGEPQSVETVQGSITGTIVINNIDYKILSVSNYNQFECYLREENGIVYQLNQDTQVEYVKFDFTLEVGDQIDLNIYTTDTNPCSVTGPITPYELQMEVVNVTTQFIAGENRKVIVFDYVLGINGLPETWIEGIGSLSGLDPIGEVVDVVDGTQLVCFNNNGEITYFNNATSCDNTTLNVPDNLKSEIILAPNPVKNISILQLPVEAGIDLLRIYDLSGRLISEEIIVKNYHIINVMDYAAGIYFYQVLSGNTVIKTERFIIQ